MPTNNRGNLLIAIAAERTGTGVKVKVKSEVIAQFFKQATNGVSAECRVANGNGTLKVYKADEGLRRAVEAVNTTAGLRVALATIEGGLYTNGLPNLSLLRAVGLGDGIEVEFAGVFLNPEVKQWVDACRAFAEAVYKAFATSTVYESETYIRTANR